MSKRICAYAEALSWPPDKEDLRRLEELHRELGKILEDHGVGSASGEPSPDGSPGQYPALCFEAKPGTRAAELVRSHLHEKEAEYRWNVVSG